MGPLFALLMLMQQHGGRVPLVSYHLEVTHTLGTTVAVVADTVWVLPQQAEK